MTVPGPEDEWLVPDEEVTGESAQFLARLRELAPRWACREEDTWVLTDGNEVGVYVEVGDAVGDLVLFSVCVELVGDRLRCHELDLGDQGVKQEYVHFPPLERHGPPGELADAAAAWVADVLDRPLVCEEWPWQGRSMQRWYFTDDGQLLAGGAPPPAARAGLTPKVRHVRGTPAG